MPYSPTCLPLFPSVPTADATTTVPLESLSREEAVLILRSTADYLEGRADIATDDTRKYRLRTLAAKYRTQAQEQVNR